MNVKTNNLEPVRQRTYSMTVLQLRWKKQAVNLYWGNYLKRHLINIEALLV